MLIVKKFGGTSVGNKERIFNVARRCAEDFKKGNDVIVVLSAMGKTTDELIAKAKDINPDPPKRELDMLLTTGEQVSVALMAMAFDTMDIPAVSLNAFQVAMHTTRVHGNARLKRIDTDRIMHELEHRRIVIVTGFQGVNKYDNYTTLGRGIYGRSPGGAEGPQAGRNHLRRDARPGDPGRGRAPQPFRGDGEEIRRAAGGTLKLK